jgi:hypothetical protein
LQDFEDWIYQGWVTAGLLHGVPSLREHFQFAHYPVPNAVSQVMLAGATFFTNPRIAADLFLCFFFAVGMACIWRVARRTGTADTDGSPGAFFAVLLSIFILNSAFWDGYANYQISLILFMFAFLLPRKIPVGWIVALSLGLFFAHASTYCAFVLLILLREMFVFRRFSAVAALAPSLVLMAWYAHLRPYAPLPNVVIAQDNTLLKHLAYKAYTFTKAGPFHNLVDYSAQSLAARNHLLYLAGVVINVLFAAALFTSLCIGLYIGMYRRRNDATGQTGQSSLWRSPEMITSAVLLLLFMVLSTATVGVVNLGERFLYPALFILLLELRTRRFVNTLAVLTLAGCAINAWQCMTMSTAHVGSPVAAKSSEVANGQNYYQKFGLYTSRIYVFDEERVFLKDPNPAAAPPVEYETSILLGRKAR